MKSHDSVISKIWRRIFPMAPASGKTHDQQPTRLDGSAAAKPGARKTARPAGIEMLEGRIAPATLINPTTLVYTDIDGDQVTVKFSKGLFDGSDAALNNYINQVFKFSTGSVHLDGTNDPGTPQQLISIDLTKIPTTGFGVKEKSPAAGVSFSVTAEKADTLKPAEGGGSPVLGQDGILDGDGFANVGAIIATSSLNAFGLGKVTIDGDLGQIDAGTFNAKVGLKALKVHSIGAVSGTQGETPGSNPHVSIIIGKLGSLTVETDIVGARIHAATPGGTGVKTVGSIGNITIGGALIGKSAVGPSSDDTGLIRSDSSIGKVKIGSGLEGDGILGGGGVNAGSIIAITKLESIVVNGDVVGGGGGNSGSIFSSGKIGSVLVTGDVWTPSTVIGGGTQAGSIVTGGDVNKIVIGGKLAGGVASKTGTVYVGGNLNSISIGGDVVGASQESGGIQVDGKLGKVTIEGSLLGGTGQFSGHINSDGGIGSVVIGGDVKGNDGSNSERTGVITSFGSIGKVTIGGSLIGGDGRGSGVIYAGLDGTGNLGTVIIAEQVLGGDGDSSGAIFSGNKIGSVVINSSGVTTALQGGLGQFSGSINSTGATSSVKLLGGVLGGEGDNSGTINGLMKKVAIAGDLQGGRGDGSGSIQSLDDLGLEIAGDLGSISIAGKLLAGEGDRSGAIYADGNLKSVVLGGIEVGDFETGGPGEGSAAIFTGRGLINDGDAGTIRVLGSIDGLSASHTLFEIRGSLKSLEARGGIANGEIHIGDQLGSLTVGVKGNSVPVALDNVLLTAGGITPLTAKAAVSIGSITVYGDVTDSQILAGYDVDGSAANADAQINKVTVTGNWTASSLVAGIAAVNGQFGDETDAVIDGGNVSILSRIANVVIGGTVSGTDDPTTDDFGFVAQQIGTFRVGGVLIPNVAVHALAEDVTVREVSA